MIKKIISRSTNVNLIKCIKRRISSYLLIYGKQINRDLSFFIKFRPSKWLSFISPRIEIPVKKFFRNKNRRRFFITPAIFLCLIFVGFFPTINFVVSNFWKLWLIPVLICMGYWLIAFLAVYLRAISLLICKLLMDIF